MNGTVLVTGGTGFIGRETVPVLRQHDLPVRVAPRSTDGAAVVPPDVPYAGW